MISGLSPQKAGRVGHRFCESFVQKAVKFQFSNRLTMGIQTTPINEKKPPKSALFGENCSWKSVDGTFWKSSFWSAIFA